MSPGPTRASVAGSLAEVARFRQVSLGSLSPVLAGHGQLAKPRWQAWRRRWQLADRTPEDFGDLLSEVLAFADPILDGRVTAGRWDPTTASWTLQTDG